MIYFMQPTDGGPIKIGHSRDVEARQRQLESHYGRSLVVLATMDGGRREERALHERFGHLRFGRTEQFRPGDDLLAYLGRPILATADPDAIEVMGVALKTVLIDRHLITKAKFVANRRGITLAQYLTDLLRKPVEMDFTKGIREMDRPSEGSNLNS